MHNEQEETQSLYRDPRYDDIIDLSRPVSRKHKPMPAADRAAQFSPFAALTGYESAVREAARENEENYERSPNEPDEDFLHMPPDYDTL